MASSNSKDIYEPYLDSEIAVTPFVVARIGLLSGQTTLRVDTYNIMCVPYRLSLRTAKFLAAFSREEMQFFQRYCKGLAGLTLMMQAANAPQPLKMFARCQLNSLVPMTGRESLGLISLEWKPCPPDLRSIIGDFMMLTERLQQEYEEFKQPLITINADTSRMLGYNNFAEIILEKGKFRVAVFLLSSGRADFLVPLTGPELAEASQCSLKLFFQSYQFAVRGNIEKVEKLGNGAQKVQASLAFSAELVDILERYRFAERFSERQAGKPPPEDATPTETKT